MIFKDRNEEKEGFLDKCRKRMKQAVRVAMAVAVGGCLWGQGEVGSATTMYYWDNPASGNSVTVNENGWISDRAPIAQEFNFEEIGGSGLDGYAAGYTTSGLDSSNNEIVINNGTIGFVEGGFVLSYVSGDASNNKVTVNNVTAGDDGSVSGGSTIVGNTANNIVTINNGNINFICGGQTQKGTAWNNTVIVNGGGMSEIHGGESQTSNVENNVVEINGGSVSSRIVGGFTISGNASNNSVIINGGNISSYVVAGSSASGNVSNNSVIIKGGEISNGVFAGTGASGNNINNSINIYITAQIYLTRHYTEMEQVVKIHILGTH